MYAIRTVAEARQGVADVREETERELAEFQRRIAERVASAEREDVKAFNAALAAGWTVDELRKIGFGEPVKKVRTRRRASAQAKSTRAQDASPATESTGSATDRIDAPDA